MAVVSVSAIDPGRIVRSFDWKLPIAWTKVVTALSLGGHVCMHGRD